MSRPGPIAAICFIWTAATVFELYHFSRVTADLPAWTTFYIIGMAAATLTGIAGMWQMKKWGLMLFIGMVIINQAVALVQGQWQINSLLLPALVIVVGTTHMKQMR
jgi:hypothetical protein